MNLNNILQGALDIQKNTGIKPDIAYISIDVSMSLEKDLHNYFTALYKNTGENYRNAERVSIHGSTFEGMEFHVLFGVIENITSYGIKGLDSNARKLIELNFHNETIKHRPRRLGNNGNF